MAMERQGEKRYRKGDVIDLDKEIEQLEADKECEERQVKEEDETTSNNT